MYLRSAMVKAALLCVCLCQGLTAAELKIVGPDAAPVGAPSFLKLEGARLGEPFDFFVAPTSGQLFVLFDKDGSPVGVLTCGTSGVYTVCAVAYDSEAKAIVKSLHVITIGRPVPPEPIPPEPEPPGPTPPGPTPDVPPDQFGNVGQLAHKLAGGLSVAAKGHAKATAAIYRQAADKLSDGSLVNVTEAHKWISAERTKVWGAEASAWQPVIDEVGKVWNKHWPMDKAAVVLFYKAVATGWEAVR